MGTQADTDDPRPRAIVPCVILMRTKDGVPREVITKQTEIGILHELRKRNAKGIITFTDAVSSVRGLKAVFVNNVLDGYMIRIS